MVFDMLVGFLCKCYFYAPFFKEMRATEKSCGNIYFFKNPLFYVCVRADVLLLLLTFRWADVFFVVIPVLILYELITAVLSHMVSDSFAARRQHTKKIQFSLDRKQSNPPFSTIPLLKSDEWK